MYMGTLRIDIHFHSINCPTLTQFHCKIWMLINRVTIYIFGILSMEELAFDLNLAQCWCVPAWSHSAFARPFLVSRIEKARLCDANHGLRERLRVNLAT